MKENQKKWFLKKMLNARPIKAQRFPTKTKESYIKVALARPRINRVWNIVKITLTQ